jgi:hypothetical protein
MAREIEYNDAMLQDAGFIDIELKDSSEGIVGGCKRNTSRSELNSTRAW